MFNEMSADIEVWITIVCHCFSSKKWKSGREKAVSSASNRFLKTAPPQWRWLCPPCYIVKIWKDHVHKRFHTITTIWPFTEQVRLLLLHQGHLKWMQYFLSIRVWWWQTPWSQHCVAWPRPCQGASQLTPIAFAPLMQMSRQGACEPHFKNSCYHVINDLCDHHVKGILNSKKCFCMY